MIRFSSFLKNTIIVLAFFSVSKNNLQAQCVEIESILVAACGTPEGHNEMFRFRVGPNPLNTSNLTVNWPSNSWTGLIQNTATAAKVTLLNADILAAGGCATLLEPTGGILPAGSPVIVVSSHLFDTTANSFGALTENTYILFQNNTNTTGGHFGNYQPTGTRTLSISFGSGCNDSVTYTRNLLSQDVGASVNFTPSGTATYVNNGCSAPVQPFTVDAGPVSTSACAGTVLNFTGTAVGHQSVQWSATQGTFSSANTLSTSYTIPASAVGTIAVILTATNSCGATITDTITINVTSSTTPTFSLPSALCNGQSAPALPTTSNNGITGTWSPSTISSTTSGTYVFTPNASQCATPFTLNVTVSSGNITPTFTAINAICQGDTLAPLPTTSNNGITGTWAPALNNMATTLYTFTPNPGQCATTTIISIPVSPNVTPTFSAIPAICVGGTLAPLPTTSNNGISGTWAPALNNTATTTYTFTPNTGQCGSTTTLTVIVNNDVVPTFNAVNPICEGTALAPLPTTSTNGISGTWTPALNNTATTTYTFTPNTGQCATSTTLTVTVNSTITPTFTAVNPICQGDTLAPLPTTSINGITGTWSPALDNTTTTTYTFTPNTGQCATTTTMTIVVATGNIIPTFTAVNPICAGDTLAPLPTTSTNGIFGTWAPALNNNTTTTYTFTPNAGQCADSTTLTVTVNNNIIPTFTAVNPICAGETLAPLPTTSTNGISGTWAPALNNNTTTTYTFTPNASQCATSTSLTVTVNSIITPTFSAVSPICQGETLAPLPTTSINGITGTWSPALDNTTTTTYTFTPNVGECATTQTLTIVVNAVGAITPIIGNNTVCIGNTLQLTNATPGGTWSSSNTAAATVDNNGLVTPVGPGFTTIKYATTSICNITTLDITVYLPPNPLLTNRYICVDKITGNYISTVNMQCGVPNEDHTFVWTLNGQPLATTSNLHVATEEGLYEVTVTNTITGCTATASANVFKSSIAIAEATVAEDFEKNQTITVNVTGGSGVYLYQLDENWPQESNQFTVYQGVYTITVIDKNGCGTETLTVFALNYPRYFTPNNDGYNDTWSIEGLSQQIDAQIYIFDRFGKLVKSIRPYLNEYWDGTLNGNYLPSTDYWFNLEYTTKNGVKKEFRSHFSLKR
ncbi:T9SS type B sorting domain-containing protein [Flavobacterium sp.]|uniref:T9SS type B sorting domain-containing protein n=1 Tax=Flavobacterium sp. TaxID=239 RepID=UPI00262EE3CD|nr:T9SS type B sorting domain-containing protein [Flavobacterium sp.]MDD3004448.1 T9SS type B sorting domain-containing protein [Flavobacterium sp.]